MPKKTTKVAKQKIKQLLQKSRAKAKQGYDDREDERLGMTRGKVAKKDFVGTMKEKEKSRRDDAGFETRSMAKGGGIPKKPQLFSLVWDKDAKMYGMVYVKVAKEDVGFSGATIKIVGSKYVTNKTNPSNLVPIGSKDDAGTKTEFNEFIISIPSLIRTMVKYAIEDRFNYKKSSELPDVSFNPEMENNVSDIATYPRLFTLKYDVVAKQYGVVVGKVPKQDAYYNSTTNREATVIIMGTRKNLSNPRDLVDITNPRVCGTKEELIEFLNNMDSIIRNIVRGAIDGFYTDAVLKKEYGGILQDMTGGVNQDPRFDIYNTGQFGEDGMLVEYADPATKVTPLLAKMAMGGPTEHGLQQGDIILLIKGDYIGVVNDNTGKMATINIATGERTAVERLEEGGVLAKMRPDKIVNQEAREYVENMIDFIGNNLSGLTMSNGDYLVSSFGYYPIWYYDKREKKWYGNTDKFSVTTAKHSSQTRPTYDAVMVSSDTLNEVISRAQDGNRFKRYGGTV